MRRSDKQLVIENWEVYNFYRNRLETLALSQFEWHDLPDTCDAWYFEKQLLYKGTACFFKPKGIDDIYSLSYNMDGGFDGYGYPASIRPINYKGDLFETDDYVLLYDNMKKETILPFIDLYARKLYECDMTIRGNLRMQNTPYVIPTTKNMALSIKNIMMRVFGYEPALIVKNNELNFMKEVQPLDLRVDFKGNEMMDLKESIWSEALHILGIAPSKTKKERLITGELMMDRQEDIVSIQSRLLQRCRFCDKINEKWGLNVTVNLTMFEDNVEELTDIYGQRSGEDIYGYAKEKTSSSKSSPKEQKEDE